MNKTIGAMMLDDARKRLENCEKSGSLRTKKTAFTRKSRLGAKNLLMIILRKICAPLQIEVDKFFDWLKDLPVSKQALSKARENLNPEFVREFAENTAEQLAKDKTVPCYKGMRLIAIDGTDVALENTKELKDAFGCSGPNKNAATALVSIAFGPLDHAIYDFRIDRYDNLNPQKIISVSVGYSKTQGIEDVSLGLRELWLNVLVLSLKLHFINAFYV
jgi:hypothetical protein